jgi:hypothetical protein
VSLGAEYHQERALWKERQVPLSCALEVVIRRAVWLQQERCLEVQFHLKSGMGDEALIRARCPLNKSEVFTEGEGFTVDLFEAFREARENGNGGGACEEGAGT